MKTNQQIPGKCFEPRSMCHKKYPAVFFPFSGND